MGVTTEPVGHALEKDVIGGHHREGRCGRPAFILVLVNRSPRHAPARLGMDRAHHEVLCRHAHFLQDGQDSEAASLNQAHDGRVVDVIEICPLHAFGDVLLLLSDKCPFRGDLLHFFGGEVVDQLLETAGIVRLQFFEAVKVE